MEQKKSSKDWLIELARYKRKFEKFTATGQSIVDRYRAEEEKSVIGTRFNILRSNKAVLKPSLYAKAPNPVVSRRYKDKNPVARVASTILERCLSYEINIYCDYDNCLSSAVDDRLLPGRGTAWLRYEPVTEEQEYQISNTVEGEDYSLENEESNAIAGDEPLLQITNETTPCDYVYWKDFAHNADARTWEEVVWVARKVLIEQNAGVERFGDIFKTLPQAKQDEDTKEIEQTTGKRSNIWEIWHRPSKTVVWVCDGYEFVLDEKPDPLNLCEFFPCPKPLYADTTTDSLIPRPDFTMYQDQADELDKVTKKIDEITTALEVKGYYAKEESNLKNLLESGHNGEMFPINNWQAILDRGGISSMLDFYPIEPLVNALNALEQRRSVLIETIYQLSGISDIQRGSSDPNETASAQQIKAQFSSVRLGKMKQDVAYFALSLLRMKAEVMAEKYQDETLVRMSGALDLPEVQQNQQILPMALAMLRDEVTRNFAIEIETDTLVEADQMAEQQARTEFLGSLTPFLEKSLMTAQAEPAILPAIKEMVLFGVRGYKVGETMESTIESVFDSISEQAKAQEGQPPPPDPEQMKLDAESQAKQMDMQLKAQESQTKAQAEAQRLQLDQAKAGQDVQLKQFEIQAKNEIEIRKLDFEKWKVERQEQTKLLLAKMAQTHDMNKAEVESGNIEIDEEGNKKPSQAIEAIVLGIAQGQAELVKVITESNAMLIETLTNKLNRPKVLVKDANGNKMAVPIDE